MSYVDELYEQHYGRGIGDASVASFVPTGFVPQLKEAFYASTPSTRTDESTNPDSGGLAGPDRHSEGKTTHQLERGRVVTYATRGGPDFLRMYGIHSLRTTSPVEQGEGRLCCVDVSYQIPESKLLEALAYILDLSRATR